MVTRTTKKLIHRRWPHKSKNKNNFGRVVGRFTQMTQSTVGSGGPEHLQSGWPEVRKQPKAEKAAAG